MWINLCDECGVRLTVQEGPKRDSPGNTWGELSIHMKVGPTFELCNNCEKKVVLDLPVIAKKITDSHQQKEE